MLSLEAARALIAANCHTLQPERIALAAARGRVIRESIATTEDIPAFHRSAFDGYAYRVSDAPGPLKVVCETAAGAAAERAIGPGECARIFTGAAIPDGAEAVAMQENCTRDHDHVTVPMLQKWEGIRRRGEDAAAGTVLIPRGKTLGSVETALLAQLGHTMPLVGTSPRIYHIATGSELVAPDKSPGPGQIRDSNSTLIAGLAADYGAPLAAQRRTGDSLEGLLSTVAAEPDFSWDILLISGGASVGDHDFGARALAECGFSIHFSRLNLRPGKPLIFATRGRQLAFVIPGNPLSHFVCWHIAIRVALDILTAGETSLPLSILQAATPLPGNPRETWWPARLEIRDAIACAHPLKWTSSGDMTAIGEADLLIRIPSNSPDLHTGAKVEASRVR
jgi:molybdopterin molybdotransferase